MSTQIQLHVRTEEMTDEMLRSEGYLEGGTAGMMNQLMSAGSTQDYFDEMHDLAAEADSVIVGNDVSDDGAEEIAQLFVGVTEVTDKKLSQASATIASSEDVSADVMDWLDKHKGDEVFAIHW